MRQLIPFLNKIIDAGNEPDANGCWNWQGSQTGKPQRNPHAGGYGNFEVGEKTRYVHNLSYLLLVVLDGHNLDDYTDAEILEMLDAMKKNKTEGSHTCENRRCVNPLHQKRESHEANTRRRFQPLKTPFQEDGPQVADRAFLICGKLNHLFP